jgi:hypothetical protein
MIHPDALTNDCAMWSKVTYLATGQNVMSVWRMMYHEQMSYCRLLSLHREDGVLDSKMLKGAVHI